MLKTIMSIVVLISTAIRLGDLVYLAIRGIGNLPVIIVVLSTVTILFGIYILIRKYKKKLLVRELMVYFATVIAIMTFNLFYVHFTVPLKLTALESVMVGSVLDIIISVVLLYYSIKQVRHEYIRVDHTKYIEEGAEDESGNL